VQRTVRSFRWCGASPSFNALFWYRLLPTLHKNETRILRPHRAEHIGNNIPLPHRSAPPDHKDCSEVGSGRRYRKQARPEGVIVAPHAECETISENRLNVSAVLAMQKSAA